jgi:hypothetical protein
LDAFVVGVDTPAGRRTELELELTVVGADEPGTVFGVEEDTEVGVLLGVELGEVLGVELGADEGIEVGLDDGVKLGVDDGVVDGVDVEVRSSRSSSRSSRSSSRRLSLSSLTVFDDPLRPLPLFEPEADALSGSATTNVNVAMVASDAKSVGR